MKTIQTTKYETTDGQTFVMKERAMEHQASLNLAHAIGKGRKVTGAAVIEAMVEDPSRLIMAIAVLHPDLVVQVTPLDEEAMGVDEP